ncbi:MAG TPA: hypothetical protein VF194_17735 [Ferrovibrio sp.]
MAGSSGATARGARAVTTSNSSDVAANGAFAASSARGGDTGAHVAGDNVIQLPSPAPNVAAYLSPFIRLDLRTRLAIVEFRDSQTGEVKRQYPSPRVVREYEQNLPDDSELRPADRHGGVARTAPHIVGAAGPGNHSGHDDARIVTFGGDKPDASTGNASNDTGVPSSVPALTRTAIAAFSSAASNAANIPEAAGGRQVAIA